MIVYTSLTFAEAMLLIIFCIVPILTDDPQENPRFSCKMLISHNMTIWLRKPGFREASSSAEGLRSARTILKSFQTTLTPNPEKLYTYYPVTRQENICFWMCFSNAFKFRCRWIGNCSYISTKPCARADEERPRQHVSEGHKQEHVTTGHRVENVGAAC